MTNVNRRITSAVCAVLAATVTVFTSAVPEAVQAHNTTGRAQIADSGTGQFVRA